MSWGTWLILVGYGAGAVAFLLGWNHIARLGSSLASRWLPAPSQPYLQHSHARPILPPPAPAEDPYDYDEEN